VSDFVSAINFISFLTPKLGCYISIERAGSERFPMEGKLVSWALSKTDGYMVLFYLNAMPNPIGLRTDEIVRLDSCQNLIRIVWEIASTRITMNLSW
jgi:hypothetical protein